MKSRHRSREIALQIIYRYDMAFHTSEQGASDEPSRLLEELTSHFNHFNVPEEIRGFASELVAGTLRELSLLDQTLEAHASHWRVSRMGFVDRSLLRMATYELLHSPDVPRSVVIDEAIQLAKQFGTAESPAFINGVLDAIHPSSG